MVAVRWLLRYGLPYRDAEELLTERGVVMDHVTVYRWVQRFAPGFITATRPCPHAPGDRWLVDKTSVKIARLWVYLYRAIDQVDRVGQVTDELVSEKRDLAATHRFFTRTLQHDPRPTEVTTEGAATFCECSMSWYPPPGISVSSTPTTPRNRSWTAEVPSPR